MHARIFRVPEVRTVSLLLWRNLRGCFTGGDGIAPHRILESGRREDESQADRIGADVLRIYPGIGRNEDKCPRMEIALLITEPNVSFAAMDQQDFILG